MAHFFVHFALWGRYMGVLQDIVAEATAKQGDVPRMLRLCMVLGARLGHAPLSQWAQQELDGYQADDQLPDYRLFSCRNRGVFEVPGRRETLDISVAVLPEAHRPFYERAQIRAGVGQLADLLARADGKSDSALRMPWSTEMAMQFGSKMSTNADCIRAWTEISSSELAGLLDQVKTRVLGFALGIEAEAPDAGNIAGTNLVLKEERVAQIFNTNITGNVHNLANGSQSFSQSASSGVSQGDLAALLAALRAEGLSSGDSEALKDAIHEDQSAGVAQGMGNAVKKWTGDMVTRAATGTVEMGLQKLTDVALPALRAYLGI